MKLLAHCKLYGFVDSAYLNGRAADDVARQLCDGGVDLIQLRAKGLPTVEVLRLARAVAPVTKAAGVNLVVNDHLDIAREVAAEFCHLGQEDFFDGGHSQVSELKLPGGSMQIGLSTHAPAQAQRAVAAGADYVAIGPIYATGTKPTAKPVTLEYVTWAAAHVKVPWFAIGGINLQNLDQVLAAGARRICVVSAILNAPDVAAACREFRRRLEP